MANPALIRKYNVPAPRYTSFPAVPFWNNKINQDIWKKAFINAYRDFGQSEGVSLYIHLPFCESLCTYCGCNKRITKYHRVEIPYVSSIMQEWSQYLGLLKEKPKLSGIHLGGGTPTFFSPSSLDILLKHIIGSSVQKKNAAFSFEGHPNNTTYQHLKLLAKHGFDRVSYGIQDFDPHVQKAIHRFQPFEKVKEVTESSRMLGYQSINFDLIYGLPHQTLNTLKGTFQKVSTLFPERIAFYSYAHLPSAFPSQKSYEAFLPNEQEKRALYEQGKIWLNEMGYEEVGMDHFALKNDPLLKAKREKTLHRNFMGYTTSTSKILLGLGCSAISDIHYAYAQNEKMVEPYQKAIFNGDIPVIKGHLQNDNDLLLKTIILNIICNGKTIWPPKPDLLQPAVQEKLNTFQQEGLIEIGPNYLRITERGKPFVRNVCKALDPYFQASEKKGQTFSQVI
ncbi:MAG: oxygen-independent coproporphyrinogen III oxidase [Cyclobacteriaceae bacterium]